MDNVKFYPNSHTSENKDSQALNCSFEKDFDFIKKYAGNRDPHFLQFLLTSEKGNPKRLEAIMCDVLKIPNASELIKDFRKNCVTPNASKHQIDDLKENCSENKKRKVENCELYLKNILEVFPDVDETFLFNECQNLESLEDCSRFINTVMISGIYPKKNSIDQSENKNFENICSTYDVGANQTSDSEISLLWEKKEKNEDLYIVELSKTEKEPYKSNINNEVIQIESSSNYFPNISKNNEIDLSHTSTDIDIQGIFQYSNKSQKKFVDEDITQYFQKKISQTSPRHNRILRRSSAFDKDSRNFIDLSDEKSLAEIIEENRWSRRSLDSQRELNFQKFLNLEDKSPSRITVTQTLSNNLVKNTDNYEASQNTCSTEYSNYTEFDFGEEAECLSKVSEDLLNEQTANLIRIFPQTDPSYLREEVIKMNGSSESMNAFVIEKLERNNMPTRADFEKKLEMEELQNKYTKNFSIEHFLKAIPEPWKYFREGNRNCTKYKTHSLCYLKSTFRKHYVRDIIDAFNKNNYNLYVTFKHLTNTESRKRSSRRSEFECNIDRPTILDIQFLQEVAFIENESKIKSFIENAKQTKLLKFEEAKRNGTLLECQCCFDTEIMVEDIVYCPKDHCFCKDCVIRSVEIEMGNGKYQFECLTTCEEKFPLTCLQNILSSELFSKVIQAVQIEEIKAAEIEDLVQCPFCNYATIMPPEEKVLICLNPECLKESCRLCREINHIPLRCDEVEKSDEVKIRTYIENKMTEALIRTCYKCNKKFVKEDGCNKMTCTCGAKMCYVCRKPVTDYSHFNGQGGTEYHKCPLYSTNDELHVDLVTQIGIEAKAEILEANPEGRLLHDPTLILPERTHDRKTPGIYNGAALNLGLRAVREAINRTNPKPKKMSIDEDEIQEIDVCETKRGLKVKQSENKEKGNNCSHYSPNQEEHKCHHSHLRHHHLRHHNHRNHEHAHNRQHQHHHHQ